MGERLLKVLGQIDFGTLDSGERSLPFGLLVGNTQQVVSDLTERTVLLAGIHLYRDINSKNINCFIGYYFYMYPNMV